MIKSILTLLICIGCCWADNIYKYAGDIGQYAVPGYAAIFSWYKGDNDGILMLAVHAGATSLMSHGLKLSVESARPHGGTKSFPSAHTSSAFVGATYLHSRYGFQASILAYAYASFVGYSRVKLRAHWDRDIFAGAIIAAAFSQVFVSPYPHKRFNISILPTSSDVGVSANLSISI